jgi:hypothetical protein
MAVPAVRGRCRFLKDTGVVVGIYEPGEPAPLILDIDYADVTLSHETTHWQLMHSAFGVFLRLLDFVRRCESVDKRRRDAFAQLCEAAAAACWSVHEATATFTELNTFETLVWATKVARLPFHLRNHEAFVSTIPPAYLAAASRVQRALATVPPPAASLVSTTVAWSALNSDVLVCFRDPQALSRAALEDFLEEGSPDRRHGALLDWLQAEPGHVSAMAQLIEAFVEDRAPLFPESLRGIEPMVAFWALPLAQLTPMHDTLTAILRTYVNQKAPVGIPIEEASALDSQVALLVEGWDRKVGRWRRRPLRDFNPVASFAGGVRQDVFEQTRYSVPADRRPFFNAPFDPTDGEGVRRAIATAVEDRLELLLVFSKEPHQPTQRRIYLHSWDPSSDDRLGLSPAIGLTALLSPWERWWLRAALRLHQSPLAKLRQAMAAFEPLDFLPDGPRRSFDVSSLSYLEASDWPPEKRSRLQLEQAGTLRFHLLEPCSIEWMAAVMEYLLRRSGLHHMEVKQQEGSHGVVVVVRPVDGDDLYCAFLSASASRQLLQKLRHRARSLDDFDPNTKALWLPQASDVPVDPAYAGFHPRHQACLFKIAALFFGL